MSEWQIIEEEFISYTGGTAQLISNGECEIHLWETPKDAQLFCDKLNELHEENKKLKQQVEELYENDKSLRKMMGNMTHHFQGVSVKEDLFNEVLKVLKEIEADDLYDDLYKTSIDTGVNGC